MLVNAATVGVRLIVQHCRTQQGTAADRGIGERVASSNEWLSCLKLAARLLSSHTIDTHVAKSAQVDKYQRLACCRVSICKFTSTSVGHVWHVAESAQIDKCQRWAPSKKKGAIHYIHLPALAGPRHCQQAVGSRKKCAPRPLQATKQRHHSGRCM